jgi:phosphoglycolate phosphatase-like HAD superfamily hydrolase
MQLLVNDSKRTKKIASLPDIPSGSLEYRIEQEFNVELNNVKTVNFPLYIKYSFSNFVPFLLQAEGTDKITVIRNALQLYLLEQKQNPKFIQNALDKIWAPNLLKALFQQMFMDETAYRKEYGAPFVKCRADWNNDTTTIPQKDLQKLLRDLQKKGYALGIATARPKSELNKFLTTFTLLDFFNPQAVVPLEGGSKAERIATALEALSEGVKPQKIDSVYVGDTIGDIQAVKKLQKDGYTIRSIAVGTDSKSKNLKQKNRDLLIDNADSYIETLDSLTSILSSERR